MSGKRRGRRRKPGIAFEAYGVRAKVQVSDERTLHGVVARLPYGWRRVSPGPADAAFSLVVPDEADREGGDARYQVCGPDEVPVDVESLEEALDALESRLQMYVAEMAEDWIFLHAGVVSWQDEAIVLPGRSFAGKTTLVRELVRAGATYYSDEYAVLDVEGLVHPYARPLAIRTSWTRQERHPVESLRGAAGLGPIAVGLVILSQYRPQARWKPERLTPGAGVLEMLNHAVPARRKPAVVMDTLEKVVASAPVMRTMRGGARPAARRILDLLQGQP